jgi:hypothetical protein
MIARVACIVAFLALTVSTSGEFIGNVESFVSNVGKSEEVWLVAFYDSKSGCCTHDVRNKKGEYHITDECSDECKGFMETWDELKLRKINTGVVDISTEEGKAVALKAGAYYSSTPAIKLYKSTTAGVTIMSYKGTGFRPAKRIKAALKQELKGLKLSSEDKFLKRDGEKENWADTVSQYAERRFPKRFWIQ